MAVLRRTKLTEKKIQNIMFKYLQDKAHDLIVPNCQVFGWEADLVSATPRRYGHEYEIKISVNDFKADKKKKKHKSINSKIQSKRCPGPAYFWYCVPKGLIKAKDVPKYAGLIHICRGLVRIVKPAPRLHSVNMTAKQINYISRGLMIRYWKGRKV